MYDKTSWCYILVRVHLWVYHASKKHLMHGHGTHKVQHRLIIIITTTKSTYNFTLQWCTHHCVKLCPIITNRHSLKQILAVLISTTLGQK